MGPPLVGAGVAGLLAGVATGAVALSRRPHGEANEAETASYQRMRNLAIGSLAGGGAALLAGGLLSFGAEATTTPRRLELGLIGAGVASLVVGAASGIANRSVHSHLQTACPDRVCPGSERANTESQRELGIVSISSLAVGAAGVGLATVLLFSEDSGERPASSRLVLQMSPEGLVLEGSW
jgi:hypothetical protein